jgi:8-oxo-dGTP pyrophosphatase MutT (NUDIX family)
MRMRPQQTQQHALLVTSSSSAASCGRFTSLCRRLRVLLPGNYAVVLSGVAAFCLLLTVVRRGRLRLPLEDDSQEKGSMHLVELYAYNPPGMSWSSWDDFPDDSNLMVLEDANLNSTGKIVPISEAHTLGLLHRGLWLAVLRKGLGQDEHHHQVMLLHRAPSLKTCPGAWGLCGEHSDPGETWDETAKRAMREELQLDHTQHTLVNLLPQKSLLVRTPYTDLGLVELQATALFAVRISHEEGNSIQPDEEVAEIKWVPIEELQNVHSCNAEITDLAKLVGYYLKQHGFD